MASLTAEQRIITPVLRTSWLDAGFVHWRVPIPSIEALRDGFVLGWNEVVMGTGGHDGTVGNRRSDIMLQRLDP